MAERPACTVAGARPATLLLAAICARLAASPELALFSAGDPLRPWWIAGGVALGQELIVALASRRPGRAADGSLDHATDRSALLAHGVALAATFALLLALQAAGARGALLIVACMLIGQALPLAPMSGAALLRSFFRRRSAGRSGGAEWQDWMTERLLARVGVSLIALLLVLAALSARVRGDPWLAAGTLLLLAGAWLCQRRSLAEALARRAGVLRNNSAPNNKSTSSSTTDET